MNLRQKAKRFKKLYESTLPKSVPYTVQSYTPQIEVLKRGVSINHISEYSSGTVDFAVINLKREIARRAEDYVTVECERNKCADSAIFTGKLMVIKGARYNL